MGTASRGQGLEVVRRDSGTRLKAYTDFAPPSLRLEAAGIDLGGGACRHAVYELQRRLRLVESDRPARESHVAPAGSVSLVVEGHGHLEPARRGMSALLLDRLACEIVSCLPVHDLRTDARGQADLVRSIADALRTASEAASEGRVAEEGRASAAMLLLTPHHFWAARCGEGAVFLSRAGFMEALTVGLGDDDDSQIDVLGAPLMPGDTFLVSTLEIARTFETEGLARPLREVSDDAESLAAAARSLSDGAHAAGVRHGALVVARG